MQEASFVERAHGLRDRLRGLAEKVEADRRVPREVADTLAENGFFRMLVPGELGGGEVHPRVFVEVLEALGRGDGATAWTVMTGATTGLLSAYLPDAGAKAIFGDALGIYAGVFAPMGRAVAVEGGYRLSGRWPFASGVDNSGYRLGGALVFEEGDKAPRTLPNGAPEIRSLFIRADQSRVEDTWHTVGMRGTGSHDLVVEDVFVPEDHTACVFADAPARTSTLYKFPLFGLLSLGVSAVGLGIARAALDAFIDLANAKKRPGGKSLADAELTQVRLATAEGELRAARALMITTVEEAWETTQGAERISDATRASLRLAATHAAHAAARTVDAVYHLGGGTSIYATKSPLQRHFRDIHVVTQHIMVNEPSLKPIGRILLGLPTNTAQL